MNEIALARFGKAYARHRASEGRALNGAALLSLPYLREGPMARHWAVRARTFDAFVRHVLRPEAARLNRPLDIVDLGAGNGWLSYRVAREGHRATAIDIRDDHVDGLGAAAPFIAATPGRIACITASFDAIPLIDAKSDITVFNAALHYSTDLAKTMAEAVRITRPGGIVTILDSPFYRHDRHGMAMVAEKRAGAGKQFGASVEDLMTLPFIEYLTRDRLQEASSLSWQRRRVHYPVWYELRPLVAALQRKRSPSRFDLWWARRP
jgi:SAM-dependent methyltransferase